MQIIITLQWLVLFHFIFLFLRTNKIFLSIENNRMCAYKLICENWDLSYFQFFLNSIPIYSLNEILFFGQLLFRTFHHFFVKSWKIKNSTFFFIQFLENHRNFENQSTNRSPLIEHRKWKIRITIVAISSQRKPMKIVVNLRNYLKRRLWN